LPQKCFFETYRFSEDLDFTLREPAHLDEAFFLQTFSEIAGWYRALDSGCVEFGNSLLLAPLQSAQLLVPQSCVEIEFGNIPQMLRQFPEHQILLCPTERSGQLRWV